MLVSSYDGLFYYSILDRYFMHFLCIAYTKWIDIWVICIKCISSQLLPNLLCISRESKYRKMQHIMLWLKSISLLKLTKGSTYTRVANLWPPISMQYECLYHWFHKSKFSISLKNGEESELFLDFLNKEKMWIFSIMFRKN